MVGDELGELLGEEDADDPVFEFLRLCLGSRRLGRPENVMLKYDQVRKMKRAVQLKRTESEGVVV